MNAAALPGGFQVAFLLLAYEFFSAVALKHVADALGTPRHELRFLGQNLSLAIGYLALLAFAPLRRACVAELRRPFPVEAVAEMLAVTVLKVALPLAATGALVLWIVALEGPAISCERVDLCSHAHFGDSGPPPSTRVLHHLAIAVLLGPVFEELVFRGFLYRAWERQWGWFPAMIATAIVFGLVHPTHVVSAALGSVVYVAVLRRTGTLWGPIAVHSGFNLLVNLSPYQAFRERAPGEIVVGMLGWAPELACLAFALVVLPVYVLASARGNAHGGSGATNAPLRP